MMLRKFAAAAAVVCVSFSSFATVRYVDYVNGDDSGDGTAAPGWKTLAYAVANAEENDEIVLAKGTHNAWSVSESTLSINKRLYIHGAGENWETTLDYNHMAKDYIKFTADGAKLSNVTVYRLGSAYQNDLIAMGANATISNVVFTSCMNPTGNNKEIIQMKNGLLTHCWFTNNVSVYNAGIVLTGGIVENCVFANNEVKTSNQPGAIVNIQNGVEGIKGVMRNCTIVNNKLPGVCYAVYSYAWDSKKGGHRVYNCIIKNNYDSTDATVEKNWTLANNTSNWRFNCISPLTGLKGADNFDDDPQFKEDGLRLLSTSPCLVKGSSGADKDGVAYAAEYDMEGMLALTRLPSARSSICLRRRWS